jgi:hypothetical protein
MFDLSHDIKVVYSQLSKSDIKTFISRDGRFSNIAGYETSTIVGGSQNIDFSDPVFKELILSLVYLISNQVNDKQSTDMVNYVQTMMMAYIKKHVIMSKDVSIIEFKLDLTLGLRGYDAKDRLAMFKRHVNNGRVVMLTPIQYLLYLNPQFNLIPWFKLICLTTISNFRSNMSFRSVLPSIDRDSRINQSLYAKDRVRLSSENYISKKIVPGLENNFSMTIAELQLEMYVRIMLSSDVPAYMKFISRGDWNGTTGSSPKIEPPRLNTFILRYSIEDHDMLIKSYVSDLILNALGFKAPIFCKSSTRLCIVAPTLMNKFLLSDVGRPTTVSSDHIDDLDSHNKEYGFRI